MDAIDIGIYALYALFAISIVGLIAMEAFNLFKDPKALIKAGIILAGFAVFFFVAYSASVGNLTTKWIAYGTTEQASKLIGAGLVMLYVFVFTALIGIVLSEVYKIFK